MTSGHVRPVYAPKGLKCEVVGSEAHFNSPWTWYVPNNDLVYSKLAIFQREQH